LYIAIVNKTHTRMMMMIVILQSNLSYTRIMACDSSLHSMWAVARLINPRSTTSLSLLYRNMYGRRTTYVYY